MKSNEMVFNKSSDTSHNIRQRTQNWEMDLANIIKKTSSNIEHISKTINKEKHRNELSPYDLQTHIQANQFMPNKPPPLPIPPQYPSQGSRPNHRGENYLTYSTPNVGYHRAAAIDQIMKANRNIDVNRPLPKHIEEGFTDRINHCIRQTLESTVNNKIKMLRSKVDQLSEEMEGITTNNNNKESDMRSIFQTINAQKKSLETLQSNETRRLDTLESDMNDICLWKNTMMKNNDAQLLQMKQLNENIVERAMLSEMKIAIDSAQSNCNAYTQRSISTYQNKYDFEIQSLKNKVKQLENDYSMLQANVGTFSSRTNGQVQKPMEIDMTFKDSIMQEVRDILFALFETKIKEVIDNVIPQSVKEFGEAFFQRKNNENGKSEDRCKDEKNYDNNKLQQTIEEILRTKDEENHRILMKTVSKDTSRKIEGNARSLRQESTKQLEKWKQDIIKEVKDSHISQLKSSIVRERENFERKLGKLSTQVSEKVASNYTDKIDEFSKKFSSHIKLNDSKVRKLVQLTLNKFQIDSTRLVEGRCNEVTKEILRKELPIEVKKSLESSRLISQVLEQLAKRNYDESIEKYEQCTEKIINMLDSHVKFIHKMKENTREEINKLKQKDEELKNIVKGHSEKTRTQIDNKLHTLKVKIETNSELQISSINKRFGMVDGRVKTVLSMYESLSTSMCNNDKVEKRFQEIESICKSFLDLNRIDEQSSEKYNDILQRETKMREKWTNSFETRIDSLNQHFRDTIQAIQFQLDCTNKDTERFRSICDSRLENLSDELCSVKQSQQTYTDTTSPKQIETLSDQLTLSNIKKDIESLKKADATFINKLESDRILLQEQTNSKIESLDTKIKEISLSATESNLNKISELERKLGDMRTMYESLATTFDDNCKMNPDLHQLHLRDELLLPFESRLKTLDEHFDEKISGFQTQLDFIHNDMKDIHQTFDIKIERIIDHLKLDKEKSHAFKIEAPENNRVSDCTEKNEANSFQIPNSNHRGSNNYLIKDSTGIETVILKEKKTLPSSNLLLNDDCIETLSVNEKVDHLDFTHNPDSHKRNMGEFHDDNHPVKMINEERINSNAEKSKESKRIDKVSPKTQISKSISDTNSDEQKMSKIIIRGDVHTETAQKSDKSQVDNDEAKETKDIDTSPNRSFYNGDRTGGEQLEKSKIDELGGKHGSPQNSPQPITDILIPSFSNIGDFDVNNSRTRNSTIDLSSPSIVIDNDDLDHKSNGSSKSNFDDISAYSYKENPDNSHVLNSSMNEVKEEVHDDIRTSNSDGDDISSIQTSRGKDDLVSFSISGDSINGNFSVYDEKESLVSKICEPDNNRQEPRNELIRPKSISNESLTDKNVDSSRDKMVAGEFEETHFNKENGETVDCESLGSDIKNILNEGNDSEKSHNYSDDFLTMSNTVGDMYSSNTKDISDETGHSLNKGEIIGDFSDHKSKLRKNRSSIEQHENDNDKKYSSIVSIKDLDENSSSSTSTESILSLPMSSSRIEMEKNFKNGSPDSNNNSNSNRDSDNDDNSNHQLDSDNEWEQERLERKKIFNRDTENEMKSFHLEPIKSTNNNHNNNEHNDDDETKANKSMTTSTVQKNSDEVESQNKSAPSSISSKNHDVTETSMYESDFDSEVGEGDNDNEGSDEYDNISTDISIQSGIDNSNNDESISYVSKETYNFDED